MVNSMDIKYIFVHKKNQVTLVNLNLRSLFLKNIVKLSTKSNSNKFSFSLSQINIHHVELKN